MSRRAIPIQSMERRSQSSVNRRRLGSSPFTGRSILGPLHESRSYGDFLPVMLMAKGAVKVYFHRREGERGGFRKKGL